MRTSVVTLKMTVSFSLYINICYYIQQYVQSVCIVLLYILNVIFLRRTKLYKKTKETYVYVACSLQKKIFVGHICIKNVAMLNKQMVHKSINLMMT
jgi:hypothetical protein